MIAYRFSLDELEAQIEQECPGWLVRARARTESFRALGKYAEASAIWSEVKPVYMRLQGGAKCAYCERKLESEVLGRGEQDVEHFRPKSSIKAWRLSGTSGNGSITPTAVPEPKRGYFLLAYHPFNYAAACKPCNSVLKKDYFPIIGAYQPEGEDPRTLLAERPLLCYPLGDFDTDPEELLAFEGLSPFALAAEGYPRQRALVTIAFFKLNDPLLRKNLFRERAMLLLALFGQLEKAQREDSIAKKVVDAFLTATAPHANCLRSFARLYRQDRERAQKIQEKVTLYVLSAS